MPSLRWWRRAALTFAITANIGIFAGLLMFDQPFLMVALVVPAVLSGLIATLFEINEPTEAPIPSGKRLKQIFLIAAGFGSPLLTFLLVIQLLRLLCPGGHR